MTQNKSVDINNIFLDNQDVIFQKKRSCYIFKSKMRFLSTMKIRNRWARVILYCAINILCSGIYYNWPYFQLLLEKKGVYEELCSNPYDLTEICEGRNAKMQSFLLVASSFEYIMTVLAGAILDHLGPLICGLLGMLILALGMISLIVANSGFFYYLSFILLGSATNLISYPTFIIGDDFPTYKSAVVTLILSCQIGASTVPVIMDLILNIHNQLTVHRIFIGYLLLVVLPCTLIFYFSLPFKRIIKSYSELKEISTLEHNTDSKSTIAMQSFNIEDTSKKENEINIVKNENDIVKNENQGIWEYFLREMKTPEIHLFTFFYIVQLLLYIYVMAIIVNFYDARIGKIFGISLLTQAIWGIVLGWIVSKVGTLYICLTICIVNVIIYIALFSSYFILWPLVVFPNIIIGPFVFVSKYNYVMEIYKTNNFGKLTGYCGLMGGLTTLVFSPLSNSTNYKLFFIFLTIINFFSLLVLLYLFNRKKKGINYLYDDLSQYKK